MVMNSLSFEWPMAAELPPPEASRRSVGDIPKVSRNARLNTESLLNP